MSQILYYRSQDFFEILLFFLKESNQIFFYLKGYTDLSLSDQVHLIECCWMELLLLNCAFRSIEHGGKSLAFAPDLVLDR